MTAASRTLGFVIDGARADGVDVSPIGLDLRMDFGIAVALRCRGVEVACTMFSGDVEGIDGSRRTDEEGLDAESGIVDRARG